MWLLIWTLLVVAALVVAFFVVRSLWRKFKAVFTTASASAERAGEVFATSTERTELKLAEQPSTAHTINADPVELLMRVERLRDERLLRLAFRRRPRPAVYRRWLSIYR